MLPCFLSEGERVFLSLQAILLSLNLSLHNLGILPISLFSFIYLGTITITNNLHNDNGTETREIGANIYNLPRIFHQMSIQSQFGIFIAREYDILHRTVY